VSVHALRVIPKTTEQHSTDRMMDVFMIELLILGQSRHRCIQNSGAFESGERSPTESGN
jgi:hypothetical protein